MSILDYFRKKPEPKEKIIPEEMSDQQWKTLTIGGIGQDEKSTTLLEEYYSWTYANVTAISEAVGDIDFELYKVKKNGDVDEVGEHPILELLHQPNPYMTKREFVSLCQTYKLLTGETPIRIKKTGKIPTELWPLNPLNFTPIIGKTTGGFELIVRYEYTDTFNGQVNKITLQPDEVIFIKNMNPKNPWRGYGVVEAAQNSIDTIHYSERYNLNFFKNSAVPFTVLYTDQKLTQQVIERLKQSWNSSYRGVNNAFKTAILEAGLKVEKLQQTSKDMDFIEQQKFLRDKLMAMFKTTKIALGITEDVNRANAEASEYVFAKNCVRPKMAQFIESFNEFLLPLLDNTGTLFLDFVDPVPQDRTTKVQEYTAAVDKWMTKNEIRDEEGLPPLDGGDEIWQALNLTTMSNPTPNTPEVQTTPKPTEEQGTETPEETEIPKMYRILKPTGKRQLKSGLKEKVTALKNRNIRYKQMRAEIEEQIKEVLKSKIKPRPAVKYEPKYKDMTTKEDTDKYIKTLISNSDKFEKKMNDTFKWKYYQPQMEEVLNKLKKGTKFILTRSLKKIEKAVGDEFMFNEEKYILTGIDLMTPLLREILISQGAEAMLTVKPDQIYSLLDAARKYLNQKPAKLAKSITETAYTRVRGSLAEGIKNGEGITELRARVLEQYKSLEIYQAETIARTEVTRATNFAAIDAFKQSGVVEGKEWIVTDDDRLCFPENTNVLTNKGNIKIQDLKVNDIVKTKNGFQKVVANSMRLHTGNMVVIKTSDKEISSTPEHPYYTQRGWVEAKDLLISDILYSTTNQRVQIIAIHNVNLTDAENFETLRNKVGVFSSIFNRFVPVNSVNFEGDVKIKQEKINRVRFNLKFLLKSYIEFFKRLSNLSFNLSFATIPSITRETTKRSISGWDLSENLITLPTLNQRGGSSAGFTAKSSDGISLASKNLPAPFTGNLNSIDTAATKTTDIKSISNTFIDYKCFMANRTNLRNSYWSFVIEITKSGAKKTTTIFNRFIKRFAALFTSNGFTSLAPLVITFSRTINKLARFSTLFARVFHIHTLYHKLQSITRSIPVYNLEVENTHDYYAEGLLVHNCEYCASMEGKSSIAGLEDTYFKVGDTVTGIDGGIMTVDFDDVGSPPLHCNCRCQLKSVEKIIKKTTKPVKKEIPKDEKLLSEIEEELNAIRGKTTGAEEKDTGKNKQE